MKSLLLIICATVSISFAAQAQTTERVKQRLASSPAEVTIVEQDEAAAAVRAIDQRAKREKVYGYTILLFSDNSPQARENAFKAKEAFEHNFRDTKLVMFYESPSFYVTAGSYLTMEEAVIELNRFRQIFPKAIVQSKELEVKTFTKVEGPRDRVKHDEIVEQIDSTTTTAVVDSLVGKVFVPGA